MVGLLIAEFRRRTKNEKVLYLCPTKQLLNQGICPAATLVRNIANGNQDPIKISNHLVWNIENLQKYISAVNVNSPKKYSIYLKSIEDFILSKDLENLNLHIGKLLGFNSQNPNSKSCPDPYWISNDNLVYVFEDKKYDDSEGAIKVEHIRQATTHKDWIKSNLKYIAKDAEIVTILISNRNKIDESDKPFTSGLKYWSFSDFVEFSKEVISISRSYSTYYGGENDLRWKEFFIDEFPKKGLEPEMVNSKLVDLQDL